MVPSCHLGCVASAMYCKKESYLQCIDSKHWKGFIWSESEESFHHFKSYYAKFFLPMQMKAVVVLSLYCSCPLALSAFNLMNLSNRWHRAYA